MTNQNLINAIEKLEKEKQEILNSREYKLGNNMLQLKQIIRSFNIKKIFKKLKNRKLEKVDKRKYTTKNKNEFYYTNDLTEEKRIAIYTCITGNYDDIQEPLFVPQNIDYYLITNNKRIKSSSWKIIQIDKELEKKYDNISLNRYVKMHPSIFLKGYDYTIYIDGSIRTISDFSTIVNASNIDTGLALHNHSKRNSVYTEAKVCNLYKKGNLSEIEKQINKYKKEGFPENYGLFECGIIVCNQKNENSTKLLNDWWIEFEKQKSFRDQISLPYILWKNGFHSKDVGNLGNDIFNNPKFEIIKHKEK